MLPCLGARGRAGKRAGGNRRAEQETVSLRRAACRGLQQGAAEELGGVSRTRGCLAHGGQDGNNADTKEFSLAFGVSTTYRRRLVIARDNSKLQSCNIYVSWALGTSCILFLIERQPYVASTLVK